MVVYSSTKCGHCGISWTSLNPNAPSQSFDKIGSPVIRCSTCLKDNKTKWKLPRDLNIIEKLIYVKGKQVFGILFSFALIFIGLGLSFSFYYVEGDLVAPFFLILFFAVPGAIGLKNNLTVHTDLDYLERRFDKNGGFCWSNEIYSTI